MSVEISTSVVNVIFHVNRVDEVWNNWSQISMVWNNHISGNFIPSCRGGRRGGGSRWYEQIYALLTQKNINM